jgi:hypothetical protein
VLWAVLLAGRIDLLGDRVAASIVTGGAALVGFTSVVWFLAGPRDLRRERTLVLAPVFVAAVPALFSLRDLGGGVLVVMMSSLVGFSAAIAAGLAFASRRAG